MRLLGRLAQGGPNVQPYREGVHLCRGAGAYVCSLNARLGIQTHTLTHCVSICMDSCRFMRPVGQSADLDAYGDLLMF